ncbi:MAG: TonB-dependent receptor [Deltaproteobacteria bacterium]|nr:TonB-dependent receptor [Deltaproteobacteria bacterium]
MSVSPLILLLLAGQIGGVQPDREDAEQEQAAAEHVPVLTKAPELLEFVDPEYPEDMQAEGVAGEVVLQLTIDERGEVSEAVVLEGLHPHLDTNAQQAGLRLKFSPAEVDHVPSPVQIAFRFAFTLSVPEPPPPEADEPLPPPPDTLRGVVRLRGRRTPLEGAFVVSGELSTQTDAAGAFALPLPVGDHPVTVKAPGFFDFETKETIVEGEATEVTYYLLKRSGTPYETVIRAPKPKKEVSQVVLARAELQKVPGTFGDPLRVLENLPGMARSGIIGGELLVRGANPEDSGVYFDGVGIPILYHFGGLTSVVNAEFIEEIDFQPGGFGAEYGRATAGVVDVESRRLTGKLARGSVKIDLMDTALFYRRPITEKVAVGVAFRRSYVDALLPIFLKAAGAEGITLAPQYTDYQLKVDWDAAPDQDVSFFLFGSNDTFKVIAPQEERDAGFELKLRIGFHRLMGSHVYRLSPKLTLVSRPWVGVTLQSVGGGEVGQTGGGLQIELRLTNWEAGLRERLTYELSDRLTLRAGLDLYYLAARAVVEAPIGGDIIAFPAPEQPLSENQEFRVDEDGMGDGLWIEATWKPSKNWSITPGLRTELYFFPEKTHPTLEPRLAVRWKVREGSAAKLAVGHYRQAPDVFAIGEQTGNPLIEPEAALHYVVGWEQQLTELIDLNLELFYNDRFHRVVSSNRVEIVDGEAIVENYNNDGLGRAYGAELLLRHKLSERFFGWVAYTLMRSTERSHPGDPFIVTDHDQTHILTVIGSYRPWRPFEVGLRFRLVTGNPYTPIEGASHDLDTLGWPSIRGEPNSERMPTFHQLDLRAEYTSTYDLFTVSYFLDLLNAYNAKNAEDFQYGYRKREKVNFYGLPIFPVLGVRGEF